MADMVSFGQRGAIRAAFSRPTANCSVRAFPSWVGIEPVRPTIVLPETFSICFPGPKRGRIFIMVLSDVLLRSPSRIRALMPGRRPGAEAASRARGGRLCRARYEPQARRGVRLAAGSLDALEPKPVVAMAALFKAERPFVTRCVKLNNYWCIKSARWNGELATDGEGHVGFVSADHGADAAATLLRAIIWNSTGSPPSTSSAAGPRPNATSRRHRRHRRCWRCGASAARCGRNPRFAPAKGGAVRYTAKAGAGGKPGAGFHGDPLRRRRRSSGCRASPRAWARSRSRSSPQPAPARGRREPAAAPRPPAAPKPAPKVQVPPPVPPRSSATAIMRPVWSKGSAWARATISSCSRGWHAQPNLTHVMLAMSAFELGALRASPEISWRAPSLVRSPKVKENAKARTRKAEGGPGRPQNMER